MFGSPQFMNYNLPCWCNSKRVNWVTCRREVEEHKKTTPLGHIVHVSSFRWRCSGWWWWSSWCAGRPTTSTSSSPSTFLRSPERSGSPMSTWRCVLCTLFVLFVLFVHTLSAESAQSENLLLVLSDNSSRLPFLVLNELKKDPQSKEGYMKKELLKLVWWYKILKLVYIFRTFNTPNFRGWWMMGWWILGCGECSILSRGMVIHHWWMSDVLNIFQFSWL